MGKVGNHGKLLGILGKMLEIDGFLVDFFADCLWFGRFLVDFCWIFVGDVDGCGGCSSRSRGVVVNIRRRGLLQADAKVVLWSALTRTTTMGHLHMPRASDCKI